MAVEDRVLVRVVSSGHFGKVCRRLLQVSEAQVAKPHQVVAVRLIALCQIILKDQEIRQ